MKRTKLDGNGLWESCRMIIPQHKNALLELDLKKHVLSRPEYDTQVLEEFSYRLNQALKMKEPITLEVYGTYESREVSGIVLDVDIIGRRAVKMQQDDSYEWIRVEDILEVRK
ncbi:YolD-like family protein [Paenibacillus dendritiformis]|uniref:YolD-like family protein n=1 Tax=Paenibacillus dendritiformis TaxID=130049 RepID=UPI000DA80113|nr:YolD-like family protein [Paenibacillus dendritiformis]PZM63711.1 YolD-like family protein [Paenibacillus dendritiformis]